MALTDLQQRFVAEYLVDLNASEAAKRAGSTAKRLDQAGYAMLSNAEVSAAIAEGKAKQLNKADLTAMRVLEELRRLAFSDVGSLFDEDGNLRPIHTLTPEQRACIASVEVVKKNIAAGDGKVDEVYKVKTWDKTRTLEMLAKHFSLLTERVDLQGEISIKHEL